MMKVVTWSSNIRMTLLYVTPHYEQPLGVAMHEVNDMHADMHGEESYY
jgi:hypothetical protein